MPDLNLGTGTGGRQSARLHLRGKPGVSGEQVGVMRPGSGVKEYDLIPAVPQEAGPAQRGPVVPQDTSPAQRGPAVPQGAGIAERGPAVPKAALSRSFMCPLTSKLSRTTRTNFQCRERTIYVPYGTGADVMAIGDKTSFNIHLSENQVRPTSLHASSLRNREIERLITKQRRMTLDDMRDRGRVDAHVNHSSIWGEAFSTGTKPWQQQSDKRGGAISAGTAPQQQWNDSREHISSRQKPRLWQKDMRREVFSTRTKPRQLQNDTQNRVEVFSNYCRHCGGRK
nr:uncharacterized protein LOC128696723 [Cherax quadricarinatus]